MRRTTKLVEELAQLWYTIAVKTGVAPFGRSAESELVVRSSEEVLRYSEGVQLQPCFSRQKVVGQRLDVDSMSH